jgi:hypothetical protein
MTIRRRIAALLFLIASFTAVATVTATAAQATGGTIIVEN